jgi:predicted nucleotidyltransferase
MRRDEALARLAAHRSELQSMGIASLSIFGSVARDEAADSSDVDLLVEFAKPVGLLEFARVRRRLTEILGCEADLVTVAALRDEMRDEVLKEAIRAA